MAVTDDGKGSIWLVETRRNLDDALKVQLNGLSDIAAVDDFIVLAANDKQAVLKITKINIANQINL